MLLEDRLKHSVFGKLIAWLLLLTTQVMTAHIAYAQDDLTNAINDANVYSQSLLNSRSNPTFDNNGQLLINGQPSMTKEEITGQRANDYVPAMTDTYGSDANTLIQGQVAQQRYDQKTLDTAESSGEIAFHLIKNSFATQKPDLTNDPLWNNTDNIFSNLETIAQQYANCQVSRQLLSSGSSYHVPRYETCERLPAIEENFTIGHDYKVGVLVHESGPVNLVSCGAGCIQMWVGTIGNNYWPGSCTIYEESMQVKVIQPQAISYAKLTRSVFDDYHQVYLNEQKIYNGPNANFPPETSGSCELSTSWNTTPNIEVTSSFANIPENTIIDFKTRTSVTGGGEGYSSFEIHYNVEDLVYDESWTNEENINKALEIKRQADDGFCTASFTCNGAPTLDANGCGTVNGIYICESDFMDNPVAALGITPFCRSIDVSSNCAFNEGEVCTTDLNGVETCFSNDTASRNTCTPYESDPQCSYVKTECVEGAEGTSGNCYVQEDTYDCGFDASLGQPTEEEVIICDGQLKCVGESCYSPTRDAANNDFAEVNAYMEMLKYARSDMTCSGIPDAPYNEDTPPDRYNPIPTCPSQFDYIAETGQCLKKTGCSYSENDFYVAGPRNGIQIVEGNSVITTQPSVPSCVPYTHNGIVYTCGNAQKKTATDTFYEVCRNEQAPVIPEGCPSTSHELNPNTGYCEIPPVASCPNGVPLVEGEDPWDTSDDRCRLEVPATPNCNDSRQNYNPSTGMCEGQITSGEGTCPSGVVEAGYCTGIEQTCIYEPPPGCTNCTGTRVVKFGPYGYLFYLNGNGIGGLMPTPRYGKYYAGELIGSSTQYQTKEYELCWDGTVSVPSTCPEGETWIDGKCIAVTSDLPSYTCSAEAASYDPTLQKCIIDEPVTTGCPSHYPVWNESEGRCESRYLPSDIAISRANHKEQAANSPSDKLDALTWALSPFISAVELAVPSATADGELHPNEESKLTQASMQEYVADKFLEMAESQEEDMAMYEVGQAQLMSVASARGASSPETFSAAAQTITSNSSHAPNTTPTNGSGGTTNVTCQLFKGTAQECKIAVGGMQNCCESPTTVSLGDYINLTQKMLQMDALTGEVMGLEGYTGVWDTATNWASEAATSAWDAVQGAFASGADVAAQEAVSQTGQAAGEGIMASIGQAMMQYTYDFLATTFGPQVAGMFFTVGASGTVTGPSAAVGAAGTALMYVYYAYLAYVVFNLLIGIIYECEEEELDLAMKRELLSTHKVGSYCKSEVLGACIEKRHSYCVFDSPLSRIIMEQTYQQPQMGLSWGTAKNPNCQGLAIADLNKVDWDLVDLDEWIGILVATGNYTDMVNVDIDSLTGAGSNLNYEANGTDRLNALDIHQDRVSNIDGDEVRRDAYEDAWNENQRP